MTGLRPGDLATPRWMVQVRSDPRVTLAAVARHLAAVALPRQLVTVVAVVRVTSSREGGNAVLIIGENVLGWVHESDVRQL